MAKTESNSNIVAKQKKYNAEEYFNSWYKSFDEFSDRITISPNSTIQETVYHYNLVENIIIELLHQHDVLTHPVVMDLGSGYGHWIDFYGKILQPSAIYGYDISQSCCDKLNEKYTGNELINIQLGDIASESFNCPQTPDIINVIGVLFHIVEDDLWENAMRNMANLLNKDGLLIIGGEFGDVTENAQFHKVDTYQSWEEKSKAWHEFKNTEEEEVLYNKRVRAYDLWESTANKFGLEIISFTKGNPKGIVRTPQNNVMVLKKV